MKQFHQRIKLYRYLRKYAANLSIEPLSKTNLREMLAGKNPLQPHQEEFVQWVNNTIPNNDNWRVWLARHYKKKPEDFTPEIKSKIQHYVAMARVSPEVERVRFDKTHDLHTGLSMLEAAEREFHIKNAKKEGKVYPTSRTKFFNKASTPNRAWFHLGTNNDRGEADAMGHCADTGNADSKLISLRDIVQDKGITYHIPRVTASVYEFPDGSFYIGQMKGPQNKKPDPIYHKDIMELLKNPKMIGLLGLEYNPKNDFKFEELTPEQQEEVLQHNPYFIKNNKEAEVKSKEIAKNIKRDISKIKDLTEGHISLFKDKLYPILKGHPNLLDDLELVEKLYNTNDSELKNLLIQHGKLFTKAPYLVEKLANDEDERIRQQIATYPALFTKFPHLVEKLANDEEARVRKEIAKHGNLLAKFPQVFEKLANDNNAFVRNEIAQHANLLAKFPYLVEKLANDSTLDILRKIAQHHDLLAKFPHVLEKLANDTTVDIRQKIAQNLNLPTKFPHLVEKLANDEDWHVRAEIAENSNLFTLPHIVKKIANDKHDFVRAALASNQDLLTKAPHLVEKLANDKNGSVREAIASQKDLFTKFPHLAEKLANDESYYVRQEIAKHPDLFTKKPHLAEKLANDEDYKVRRELAEHPDLFTVPHVAEKLADDKDWFLRRKLAEHPKLFNFPSVVEKLANDKDLEIRLKIAKNPNLFMLPNIVEKLANDRSARVRIIIAGKPMLRDYPEIANKLLNDKSSMVRDRARKNLEDTQLQFKFRKMKKFEKLTINRYLRLLKYRF